MGGERPVFDLLVKGGTVIDPSQGLSAQRDIAVRGGTIARLAEEIPVDTAFQLLPADGLVVTPGLIDIHVHVYDAFTPIGIPADPNLVAKGVTTALDAGSAGAHNFPGFRRFVIDVAQTRVRALLNVATVGLATFSVENNVNELADLRHLNTRLAIETIDRNRDVILGVKIRLTDDIEQDRDIEALRLAREVAEAVGLPLMVHYVYRPWPIAAILKELKPGDVLTHCYHGTANGVLDPDGRVEPAVRRAVERGVRLDLGHGAGSFSFDVAERALAQDLPPGTISSDLHQYNVHGPVFDLATTLSKFLHLGMSLEEVVERATTRPAQTFGFPEGLGTLREGAEADIAIFELQEGDFEFSDVYKEMRIGHRRLVPRHTVKGGHLHGGATRSGVRL